MNILLKDFQTQYVSDFVTEIHDAVHEVRRAAARNQLERRGQAIALSSPTGSGKTVMLIETIERILRGDEDAPANPDATFLWITDQPELNLQTRDKMLAISTVLSPASLIVLDSDFDRERFSAGKVYFLNTQKLGKNSRMIQEGDARTFSLWETIANTVREKPSDFYVMIDEAHRGMAQSAQARNEANAIVQKFIFGSPGETPPIPLIVGISATPTRFLNLLKAAQGGGSNRTTRQVAVDVAQVRESGLIKEIIQFVHTNEKQPGDMTLLRAAVRSWQGYRQHWTDYCRAQQMKEPVHPLLVVQVADAGGTPATRISATDLLEVVNGIEAEAGVLPDSAFAHAFQDHSELEVGSRKIRHLPPSEINADPDVQIVFFKTSLTTGWDCPRAEVMMSFRTASDATNIAQLVGRMVRTPLARRVDADEHLNTVALYLPHYDQAGLTEVVKRLTAPDSELASPAEVRTEPAVTLNRAPGTVDAFAALSALPSYSVPRAAKPNETKRLTKLARQLSRDDLFADAPDKAEALLVGVIDAAFAKVKDTQAFRAIVDERDTLDIRLVSYLYGEENLPDQADARQIPVSPENIEELFEAAGRKVGEGLHRAWRNRRASVGNIDPRRAKLELVALATADLKRDLDNAARKQAQTWLILYREKIGKLPESRRQAYDEIHGLASEPEEVSIVYPQVLETKQEGTNWPRHLYVDAEGNIPAKFNTWEKLTLDAELQRSDLVGWLRVVPRKPWALTIPYKAGGKDAKAKPVYIDFLMVRKVGGSMTVDIIDPHNQNLGDSADKLAGLAAYAEAHGSQFGRIESIIVNESDEIRRLDLQNADIREKAKKVRTSADVQSLFDDLAVSLPTG